MRVLHVTRDFPPRHCGGISTAVAGLVDALERAGISCAIASFDDYRPTGDRPAGPKLHDGNDSLLRIDDADDLSRLEPFARKFAPDLIQLHIDLSWEPVAELRDRLDVPILATLHVCHRQMLRLLGADRESASLAAQERALEQADRLVAPTRAAADAILVDYPGVADRLHVAGFTVDRRPQAYLAEPRLVAVGRFGAAKGTDRLIELLPHLLAEQQLKIDVIGGLPHSPQRDRRWRRRLTEAAGSEHDRLRLHGWLEPAARDEILRTARAFLSVSRIETFGLAALEAQAFGVPVCGYREPALVESAPDQLWLPEADPAEVAKAVVELLTDPARCRELGRAGRDALPAWPALVEEWRAVYAATSDLSRLR